MTKKRSPVCPAEDRARAVRLRRRHRGELAPEWAAIRAIPETIVCNLETLRSRLRRSQRDAGEREGMTTEMRGRPNGLPPNTDPG